MNNDCALIALVGILGLVASCGGTTDAGAGGQPSADAGVLEDAPLDSDALIQDGSDLDTAPPPDGSGFDTAPPDGPVGEFCADSSKASLGSTLVSPASVTSSLLVMDCCEGFLLRFHTQAQLGFDATVMVRQVGAQLLSGTYTFPTDGGGLAVDVRDPANLGSVSGSVTGSVQLEVPATYDLPTFATSCLEVSAPGQAFDGAKLFASHVPVAPWGWANRLEFRLLADSNLSASDAAKVPLDTLQVATGSALFDVLALDWYETATHTVQWDTWHNSTAIKNQLPQVGVYGLPFVVIADGQRVYLGAFMTMASSVALDMPVILIENMKDNSFAIEPAYPSSSPPTVDVRMDPRIMIVLEASGKLVK